MLQSRTPGLAPSSTPVPGLRIIPPPRTDITEHDCGKIPGWLVAVVCSGVGFGRSESDHFNPPDGADDGGDAARTRTPLGRRLQGPGGTGRLTAPSPLLIAKIAPRTIALRNVAI